MCAVPAGLTGITGTISGRADLVVFTETAAHFTTTAILPGFTGLVAEVSLVPCVAQALPVGRVTAAVCEVTVTSPITAGSPPARLAIAHTCALITRRQVAVAADGTFQPPVAPEALATAC